MPADPTTTVPPSERLPTDPAGIGHVAPDFKDRKHFNTLVIRPEYRISIRMGKIENLFADKPDADDGKRARLQVLGLNYVPMKHSLGKEALAVQWEHYKKNILNDATDDNASADIQIRLDNWVLEGGVLPPPAKDPANPTVDNFKKIRVPGGFTFMKPDPQYCADLYKPDLTKDPPYPKTDMYDSVYDYETTFISENPALGKIPIIAFVEKRDPDSAEWKPVSGAAVCFQLVKPYDLPAFVPGTLANAQINRPPLRATNIHNTAAGATLGPKKLDDSEKARNPAPDDPQVDNCHKDRGGKRGNGSPNDGTDVADVIFSCKDVKGFNTKHPSRDLPHKDYKVAEKVSNSKHLHAVKTITNEDGESGVIFMPGRAGGDRFRLKVYLSNPIGEGLVSDGTGFNDVYVETGTFVIWRNIRVSQFIHQPINAVNNTILTQLGEVPYSYDDIDELKDRIRAPAGLNPLNVNGEGDNTTTFDGFIYGIAKGFVEAVFDRAAASATDITQAQWENAIKEFKKAVEKGQADRSFNYDLDILFFQEAGAPAITAADSFTCIPMRTAKAYNARLAELATGKWKISYATNPATEPDAAKQFLPAPNSIRKISQLVMDYGMAGFMRSLSKNGYLPGLTAFHGGVFATWAIPPNHLSRSSGLATSYRGFYVWFGTDTYTPVNGMAASGTNFPYDYTSNFIHEMGHTRFRPHAKGKDPSDSDEAGGADLNEHDTVAHSVCVMSYKTCEGQYCAKCLFDHRGWDRQKLPAST